MKAEINNENKAKFFALYLGSNVIYPKTDTGFEIAQLTGVSKKDGLETTYKRKRKGCSGDYLAFNFNGNQDCNALNTKLLLKPLSSISDADAIEVADILRGIDGFDRCVRSGDVVNIYWKDKSRLTLYNHSAGYSLDDGYMESINGTFDDLDYIDFLRSRGYALPWMGLSVDEMVDAGWIKLKQEIK